MVETGSQISIEERLRALEEENRCLKENLASIQERLWCPQCQVPRGGQLSDRDIRRLIEEGRIEISPLPDLKDPSILGTCKIDFHLGAEAMILNPHRVASVDFSKPIPEEYFDKINLKKEGEINIPSNSLVIATTLEWLKLPGDIIARMEGKSSVARRGGSVQAAPLFDAGWDGRPMMELHNIGGITGTAHYRQAICAFSFTHLSSDTLELYAKREGARYGVQEGAKI